VSLVLSEVVVVVLLPQAVSRESANASVRSKDKYFFIWNPPTQMVSSGPEQ
jgi:hypothetical protein